MSSDNKNNPPFYIGQEVVALDSHSDGSRVKDKIYTVLALEKCRCGVWSIDIGDRGINAYPECIYCKHVLDFSTEIEWHESKHFAPVSRLRVSEHLTIAEGLAVDAVEERADVLKKVAI